MRQSWPTTLHRLTSITTNSLPPSGELAKGAASGWPDTLAVYLTAGTGSNVWPMVACKLWAIPQAMSVQEALEGKHTERGGTKRGEAHKERGGTEREGRHTEGKHTERGEAHREKGGTQKEGRHTKRGEAHRE